MERIGRLRGKYPSIQKYYDIDLQVETETEKEKKTKSINQANKKPAEVRTVKTMTWTIKETVNSDSAQNKEDEIILMRRCSEPIAKASVMLSILCRVIARQLVAEAIQYSAITSSGLLRASSRNDGKTTFYG